MPPSIPLKDILNSTVNKKQEEANAKDFAKVLNPTAPGMAVHIELSRTDAAGEITITADITTQEDLAGFMEKCAGYMPRKKWFGVI